MSIVSKLTVTPLLYLSGGLFVAVLGLSGALWLQNKTHTATVATLEARNTTISADLSVASTAIELLEANETVLASTNADNATLIDELSRRLGEAVGQEQQTAAINRRVIAERDAARTARARAEAALQRERSTTYETDATCAAWGARPVCGAISDSVFDHWTRTQAPATAEGSGEAEDRGSAQAPAGPDRAHPDRNPEAGARTSPGDRPGRGVWPAEGLLLEPATGGDAAGRAGLGRASR